MILRGRGLMKFWGAWLMDCGVWVNDCGLFFAEGVLVGFVGLLFCVFY